WDIRSYDLLLVMGTGLNALPRPSALRRLFFTVLKNYNSHHHYLILSNKAEIPALVDYVKKRLRLRIVNRDFQEVCVQDTQILF
ncbi:hypothetical protein L9F63_001957, partial [Diploptera punctata]